MKNRKNRKSHSGVQTDMPFWALVVRVEPKSEPKVVAVFDDKAWVRGIVSEVRA